jgi:phasin
LLHRNISVATHNTPSYIRVRNHLTKEMSEMANVSNKTQRAAKSAAESTQKAFSAGQSAARDAADAAFSHAGFEVPEVVRSFAEQGLNQTREAYVRLKDAAEEATDVLESSLEKSRESARAVQFKALDVAKENTDAAFELARQLLAATSVADAFQLQTAFVRERFEAFVDYSKEVQATMQKAGAEASEPAKSLFERTLNLGRAV